MILRAILSLLFSLRSISFIHFVLFFFFKQKTAYEMRISDWSSDVCSSDLYRRSRRSRSLPGFQRGTISPQRGPEGPPPEEGRKHHCCSRYGPAQGQSSSRPSLLTPHLEGRGGAYAPQRTPVMTETADRKSTRLNSRT